MTGASWWPTTASAEIERRIWETAEVSNDSLATAAARIADEVASRVVDGGGLAERRAADRREPWMSIRW